MLGLGIFLEDTPDGDTTWGMSLLSGLEYTLLLVVCAWVIAMVLGSVLGVVRTTKHRFWVTLGNGYVELFRNIPLLVQFFLWYFVLPSVIPPLKRFANAVDPGPSRFSRPWFASGCSPQRALPSRSSRAFSRCRAADFRRSGAGADADADLPLRAAAHGVPHHHSAAHLRVDEPGEEFGRRLLHRPD